MTSAINLKNMLQVQTPSVCASKLRLYKGQKLQSWFDQLHDAAGLPDPVQLLRPNRPADRQSISQRLGAHSCGTQDE